MVVFGIRSPRSATSLCKLKIGSGFIQASSDCECRVVLDRNVPFCCVFRSEYFAVTSSSLARR